MSAINRVLVVDDDAFTQKILANAIAEHYQVETADDGEAAIERASAWHPDIVLLDVEMPGRNGYEVCDFLKRQKSTSHIPIIFVSSHSSVRERMLGFEVGADDYLVKPCSKELLIAKLEKMDAYIQQKVDLETSYQSAQDTALEAIATSADLGKAVRFIERSYLVPSLDALSEELINILRDMQLSASVMFVARHANHYACTKGNDVAPLEQDLLKLLHSEKRFIDFGCRTQVNYPRVALLIKNMPLDDRNRYGRLKDIIPFVLGAVDAKVRVIDAEQLFKEQNMELGEAVESVRQSLAQIGQLLEQNQSQVGEIMSALNVNLASELHRIGLEEDQENYILDQFDDASQGISQTLKCGQSILETMESVVKQLEHLAVDQHQIITETLTVVVEEPLDTSGDVELF